jgi:hypothetical protein
MTCQLYRHFDGAGVLLYIGIARAVSWRLMAHEKNAGWWRDMRTVTVSAPYRSRAEALAAEAAAIVAERPKWNQQHHPEPVAPPIADAQAGKALLRRLRRQGDGDGNRFQDRVDSALAALSAAATDRN